MAAPRIADPEPGRRRATTRCGRWPTPTGPPSACGSANSTSALRAHPDRDLGPDILAPDFADPAERGVADALHRIAAHPDEPIAAALLDQRNLAGVGMFYACEALFAAGCCWWTLVVTSPTLAQLPSTVLEAVRRTVDLLLHDAAHAKTVAARDRAMMGEVAVVAECLFGGRARPRGLRVSAWPDGPRSMSVVARGGRRWLLCCC